MKKILLFLLVATLGCGNVYSQTKKPVRRTASVAAKQKAEAEAKAKAEAEEKAKAEAEEKARISENNMKCKFSLETGDFISQQGYENYVIYEIPEMTASELKSAVYTILTSMFKSPKDAITSVSDNILQLEGYSPSLFEGRISFNYKTIFNHIIFGLVIQFKDGKIRYNTPSLKYIHMVVENSDTNNLSNISGVNIRGYFDEDADSKIASIENYFNNLIATINSKLKQSNDW
jgi:hypothetical protein